MEKQNPSFHKYYMSRAKEEACFVPFGEKASELGFPGTWVQKVQGRAISELSGGLPKDLAGAGGWGWAGQAPGLPSQPDTRASAAIRPLSDPPPLAPSLILSCLPLPRKSPPLPGEAPLRHPPAGGGAGGGAGEDLEGLENSGGFFSLRETPSIPHPLHPLRFLWLGFGKTA